MLNCHTIFISAKITPFLLEVLLGTFSFEVFFGYRLYLSTFRKSLREKTPILFINRQKVNFRIMMMIIIGRSNDCNDTEMQRFSLFLNDWKLIYEIDSYCKQKFMGNI